MLNGTVAALRAGWKWLSVKIKGHEIKNHDHAEVMLKKISDALFFQFENLTNVACSVLRFSGKSSGRGAFLPNKIERDQIRYPNYEYDKDPMSLYWYARSAHDMPLLQFLAYYQVLEYYFPHYSKSEAHRRLKAILKDPIFRADRDDDVSRLVHAAQMNRSGAYGDERSQLQATLNECTSDEAIRKFIKSSEALLNFYHKPPKGASFHRLPIEATSSDLRNDVAIRIYQIRCRIVHTKSNSDDPIRMIIPFSKEAEQIVFDIDLIRFLARQVLISSSSMLKI